MAAKRRKMLFCYYLPGILAAIRLILTFVDLVWNPFGLTWRFFQLILMASYAFHLFSYFILYTDGIPIITIIAPDIVHGILVFIFTRRIPLVSLGMLLGLDILFLFSKSIKAYYFPFDIDSDEEEDLFEDDL